MDARRTAAFLLALALPAAGLAQNFGIKEISRWDGDEAPYADVWVDGDVAYIGHLWESRVNIIDISDRVAPRLLSTFQVPAPNEDGYARELV